MELMELQFDLSASDATNLELAPGCASPPHCRLCSTLIVQFCSFDYHKRAYDNYCDAHAYFRKLTLSHGLLIGRADHLEVQLISPVNLPPKTRPIAEKLLVDLNAEGLELPDGTSRKIRFYLGRKETHPRCR